MEAERPLLAVGDGTVPPTFRIGQSPMGIRPSSAQKRVGAIAPCPGVAANWCVY